MRRVGVERMVGLLERFKRLDCHLVVLFGSTTYSILSLFFISFGPDPVIHEYSEIVLRL